MLIKQLQLTNIKNYTEQTFDFEAGVTAICGLNGSGKTTIIEAIAWVLFDHLDYKREDFIRKGARKGSVNVVFVSQLDGREYAVFRDNGGNYYAFDQVVQVRIAQQKQEMLKWLCEQHGVEPGTDLSILFRTTIGVPQGTFTVDFLQPPAKRKPIFDKILKVEDYIKAADEIKDMIRLIEKRIAEIREQIAGDEGELKRYDELVVQHTNTREELTRLTGEYEDAKINRQVMDIKVSQFDNMKTKLDRLSSDLQNIELTLIQKTERRKGVALQVAQAQQAADLVIQTQTEYVQHQDARQQLQKLAGERAQRDQKQAEYRQVTQQQMGLDLDIKHHQETLSQIEQARAELALLEPKIKQQEELETQLRHLQRQMGEKEQLDRNIRVLGRELDELRQRYSEIAKSIEEAERHKGANIQVQQLMQTQSELNAQLNQYNLAFNEIKYKQEQLTSIEASYQRTNREATSLASRIESLRPTGEKLRPINELENDYQQATNEAAQVRALIDRDERMMKESKGGLCPLLSERCHNIPADQTLASHFQLQVKEQRRLLQQKETALTTISHQVAAARAAVSQQATLAAWTTQLTQLQRDEQLYLEQLTEMRAKLQQLGSVTQLLENKRNTTMRLAQLEIELSQAREGMVKYAQLEPRRSQLEELKTEGRYKRNLQDSDQARRNALLSEIEGQPALESQLVKLGNPRATAESLTRQVARESQLRTALLTLEQRSQELKTISTKLATELEIWADIDRQWHETNSLMEQTRPAHDTFIVNKPLANNLTNLLEELKTLDSEINDIQQTEMQIKEAFTQAGANYSAATHSQVRSQLEDFIRRSALLESQCKYTEDSQTKLQVELERLTLVRQRQNDKISRRNRLNELEELANFIRDCLKKACPYITEAYLHTISIEANQLYREISGNSLISLQWNSDYEIVLEEEGRDRVFHNLSGGEQMVAALSVRLALLKEFSELRFAFFDEPTTNMDEDRRRNLAQQIGAIKDFEQLFVVSHDDSFEGYTDQVIQLKRDKG